MFIFLSFFTLGFVSVPNFVFIAKNYNHSVDLWGWDSDMMLALKVKFGIGNKTLNGKKEKWC